MNRLQQSSAQQALLDKSSSMKKARNTRSRGKLFVLSIFSLVASQMVFGLGQANAQTTVPSGSLTVTTDPATAIRNHQALYIKSPNAKPNEKRQIWNLQNADIRAVIDTVSKVTGRNFIVDPRVTGKMTIVSAKPMNADEFYQAFLSMLQVLNYTTVPSGNIIKIVPAMDAKEMGAPFITGSEVSSVPSDQVVVRMVPIIHTSAQELTSVIRPLMQDSSTVNAYTPSNSLILAGASGNIDKLVKMIHKLDEEHSTRVVFVPLKHGDATKVVTMLKGLQETDRAQGKISNVSYAADASSNTILISGAPENIKQARSLINHLDSAKAVATAKIIKLNYLDAKTFAPTLEKLATASLGDNSTGSKVAIEAQEDQNSLIVEAPAAVMQQIHMLVSQLDHRPGQVLVQAIIARVDSKLLNNLGIMWGMAPPNQDGSVGVIDPSSAGTAAIGIDPDTGKIGAMGTFGAILSAIKSNTNSNVLSTPSIMVLNNQKASIAEGKTIRVLDQTATAPGAATDSGIGFTSNYTDKKIDLKLDVKPQISPNDNLQLSIKQQNDSLEGVAGSALGQQPTIDTQSLNTNVMVHSGQILVLGGLVSNDTEHDEKKVPLLGSIPILGHLFRYHDKSSEKRNLMVFIRTEILHNDKESTKASMQRYNFIQQEQIASETGNKMDLNKGSVLPQDEQQPSVRIPDPFAELETQTQ